MHRPGLFRDLAGGTLDPRRDPLDRAARPLSRQGVLGQVPLDRLRAAILTSAASDMTPQANFMVIAAIRAEREAALRALLATMNRRRGVVDPSNPLFPFDRFKHLHVALFVILRDETLRDLPPDDPFPAPPIWLAF